MRVGHAKTKNQGKTANSNAPAEHRVANLPLTPNYTGKTHERLIISPMHPRVVQWFCQKSLKNVIVISFDLHKAKQGVENLQGEIMPTG